MFMVLPRVLYIRGKLYQAFFEGFSISISISINRKFILSGIRIVERLPYRVDLVEIHTDKN